MAKLEVNIQMEKNPELGGEILVRAVLLNQDGSVARVLGMKSRDEDDVATQGHATIREEDLAWANDLAMQKEKHPVAKDVHVRN